MIIEADHFEVASKQFGATREQMRSGQSIVELAIQQRFDLVDIETIQATMGTEYRPWIRLKAKKAGIRVIVEQYQASDDIIILIHAVIPRDAHTYDEIEKLWKQYRSKA